MFYWNLKFVDCHTHEKNDVECPMSKNDFTVSQQYHTNCANLGWQSLHPLELPHTETRHQSQP